MAVIWTATRDLQVGAAGTPLSTYHKTAHDNIELEIASISTALNAPLDISKTALGTYTAWAAWTPTLSGWSGTPTTTARWTQIGKLVTVEIAVSGTSNATNCVFTLPVAPAFGGLLNIAVPIARAADNGTYVTTGGPFIDLISGSTTANCYKDATGTTWTNANSKTILAIFSYEVA